jgi:hypothetical protein
MKDNKNRYALAFMGMVLKAGWFQQMVLELLTIIDVHTMSKPVWPSGLQDFHFWHLYNSKHSVKLRAREYFKHTVQAPAATQPWRGTQQGSPLLVISHDAPLPELRFFMPQLTDKAFLSKVTEILHTPHLILIIM